MEIAWSKRSRCMLVGRVIPLHDHCRSKASQNLLLLLGQGGTSLAVVLRRGLHSSTLVFPSGKSSGRLDALVSTFWLFSGHERNMMQLASKVHSQGFEHCSKLIS